MTAADTSLVVAAFASWHEGHAVASRALSPDVRLPAHVALEAYSVLTRLPPPHRADSDIVVSFLEQRVPGACIALPPSEHRSLLREASRQGITGGSLYDAVVGATARHAGATLLTRDRRAVRVYRALGVSYDLVD